MPFAQRATRAGQHIDSIRDAPRISAPASTQAGFPPTRKHFRRVLPLRKGTSQRMAHPRHLDQSKSGACAIAQVHGATHECDRRQRDWRRILAKAVLFRGRDTADHFAGWRLEKCGVHGTLVSGWDAEGRPGQECGRHRQTRAGGKFADARAGRNDSQFRKCRTPAACSRVSSRSWRRWRPGIWTIWHTRRAGPPSRRSACRGIRRVA